MEAGLELARLSARLSVVTASRDEKHARIDAVREELRAGPDQNTVDAAKAMRERAEKAEAELAKERALVPDRGYDLRRMQRMLEGAGVPKIDTSGEGMSIADRVAWLLGEWMEAEAEVKRLRDDLAKASAGIERQKSLLIFREERCQKVEAELVKAKADTRAKIQNELRSIERALCSADVLIKFAALPRGCYEGHVHNTIETAIGALRDDAGTFDQPCKWVFTGCDIARDPTSVRTPAEDTVEGIRIALNRAGVSHVKDQLQPRTPLERVQLLVDAWAKAKDEIQGARGLLCAANGESLMDATRRVVTGLDDQRAAAILRAEEAEADAASERKKFSDYASKVMDQDLKAAMGAPHVGIVRDPVTGWTFDTMRQQFDAARTTVRVLAAELVAARQQIAGTKGFEA